MSEKKIFRIFFIFVIELGFQRYENIMSLNNIERANSIIAHLVTVPQ